MTLQSVIEAIKKICLGHDQIKTVYVGLRTDALNERKSNYPIAMILYTAGAASLTTNLSTIDFQIILLDQVHQAREAKKNELDVQSDMHGVCEDLITQLSAPQFEDLRISKENQIDLLYEQENDMNAGAQFSFSIGKLFRRDLCEIPSTADLDAIAEQLQK
jgi:hypothetical protein